MQRPAVAREPVRRERDCRWGPRSASSRPTGSEDVEVGRRESRHVLEPNEAKQVVETVTVTLKPDKLVLIVSEARSVVD